MCAIRHCIVSCYRKGLPCVGKALPGDTLQGAGEVGTHKKSQRTSRRTATGTRLPDLVDVSVSPWYPHSSLHWKDVNAIFKELCIWWWTVIRRRRGRRRRSDRGLHRRDTMGTNFGPSCGVTRPPPPPFPRKVSPCPCRALYLLPLYELPLGRWWAAYLPGAAGGLRHPEN